MIKGSDEYIIHWQSTNVQLICLVRAEYADRTDQADKHAFKKVKVAAWIMCLTKTMKNCIETLKL